MYAHRTPGVHVEWLGTQPGIGLRRTDVAGFAGVAERGPLFRAVRVRSWAEYTAVFGGHVPAGFLPYAVAGFFANEGRTCWVVRVADPGTSSVATADLRDDRGRPVLRLTATSAGTWAHRMTASVVRTVEGRFTLNLRLPDGSGEQFHGLSPDPADPRFAVSVLEASTLVRAEAVGNTTPRDAPVRLEGGHDGLAALRPEHLGEDGLAALDEVDEIGIVAIPDIMRAPVTEPVFRDPPGPDCRDLDPAPAPPALPPPERPDRPPALTGAEVASLQTALLRHCRLHHDRFAVLDTRRLDRDPAAVTAWRSRFDSESLGEWGGLYHPWLRVPDPLTPAGELRDVPPSGHVAGVFARTDLRDGVHRAPANEIVEGAYDVTVPVGDSEHGELNDRAVNVIRQWHARGLRVAGARTMSARPQWRYVNVRRLLSAIEEAVDEQTQWAVFEPNAAGLWRDLDRVVRALLDDLWRRGALDGATAEEAYFVRCDETTNTPADIDEGRLVCVFGVRPPAPAEFVVVRVVRDATAIAFEESAGVPGG
ncbi:phage tail sheath C-terminal domain-containing protein [Actinoplanes sp. NPDC051861]|uniref:phage tail sheath C-terminal domain-containing protein n=1 Tax=Actinoplanes sp. NPDC051861 TaxID=3155170 RepID=UPI00344611F8